jgi:hypothetical protein
LSRTPDGLDGPPPRASLSLAKTERRPRAVQALASSLERLWGLLRPDAPAAASEAPSARLWPLLVICALLAAQVLARYRLGLWPAASDQWKHIAIGWAGVALTLAAAFGRQAWRALRGRSLVILGVAFVVLNVFWLYGRSDSFGRFFPGASPSPGTLGALAPFAFFSLNATFWRLVVPFGLAFSLWRMTPAALGLPLWRGRSQLVASPPRARVWPVYLALYLAILPVVLAVGGSPAFLAKYPMSRGMVAPDGAIDVLHLLAFEGLYLLIFVSGEAFWRGFLTLGLERGLGVHGLAFMLVPYVTAHFGKPLAETLGAIGAGLLLGSLALRHRTVWLGVALHYAVAVTMDLVAIWHHGYGIE